jgi:ApaG protein
MTRKNPLYSARTNNVLVEVIPNFENAQSNPSIGKFIFSYHVRIVNEGFESVKLLYRQWHIYDSLNHHREVKGEGVIGQQPILLPEQEFEYISWCPINSPIGKMYGHYTFEKLNDGSIFDVKIPDFLLHTDYILS